MKQLKIGVIGTGHMGRNHVRNLVEEKRFNLVGIYDKDLGQAQEVAQKYSIDVFEDMDLLFNAVDAVIVAVPSSLHKEVALQAAEHGVHALIEKPLATTTEDANSIVEAFEKKGLKLAVGHIERFNPVFKELKKLVDPKKIFYVEACRYSPFSGSGRITDTSVIEDLMIHDIDLVCALMEGMNVTSVHGRGESVRSDQIDFATCLLDFNGKAHAVVNASRVSQNKERMITVHTEEACYCADLLAKALNIYKSTNLTIDISQENSYKQDGIVQKVYVPIEEPLRKELVAFYDAIVNGTKIVVDGVMASNAIRICEEIANRAKKGAEKS
ncbi:MAG: Gfo/Idh/MocA family oxidoreductase [Lachnospiraceae bacterium]|nr:Gfo/Idh/MocA family oxidoreductase [Lachnospiraceae bacterium]